MFAVQVRDHIMIAHSLPGEVFGPAQKKHGATYVIDACFYRETLGAERIVVGLPLTMRGQTGPQAQKVQAFVRRLQELSAIPIEWIDERLTTVQGERSLRETGTSGRKRKQVIDQVAAQLILQQYLDAKRSA